MTLSLPGSRIERRTQDNPLDALERAWRRFADEHALIRHGGRVTEVSATHYRVRGLTAAARLGDMVEHRGRSGIRHGEIVQISSGDVLVSPFQNTADAGVGDTVIDLGPFAILPHDSWRGRAIDALGRPIDGGEHLPQGDPDEAARIAQPPALARQRVGDGFATGVRVIDIFAPICFGQRLGVFAGSGVGKSTLLAMLASAQAFDTVVVALVGERGREVREFLEDTIGPDCMAKTIAVVSTSDESAMMRRRAPDTAMRVAEHFRLKGDRVLLILDSITRFSDNDRRLLDAANAIAAGLTVSPTEIQNPEAGRIRKVGPEVPVPAGPSIPAVAGHEPGTTESPQPSRNRGPSKAVDASVEQAAEKVAAARAKLADIDKLIGAMPE